MIEWKNMVGESGWDRVLLDIVSNETIIENLNRVNLYYRYANAVYPPQKDVFKAFKVCPYDKLSVVILGQD
jgi:uracil-DNA glycosylase